MRPHPMRNDLDLSDFEHSRNPGRIAAGILIVCGIGMCLPLMLGVLNAEAGVYSSEQKARLIGIGVPVILLTFGLLAAIPYSVGRRVIVDFEQALVATESRTLGIRRRKKLALHADGKIVHRETDVCIGNHHRTVWLVEYACADGTLELHRQSDAIQGRDWAERFARYLDLPLVEAVEDVFVVRRASELDRSVAAQGLAEGLEWPKRQVSDRLCWKEGRHGGVEISIEPPGPGWATFIGAVFVVGCGAVVVKFASDLPASWSVGTIFFLVLLTPVLGLFGFIGVEAILSSTVRVERWRVDGQGLGFKAKPSSRMPVATIEQVEISGNGCLSVRSDEGSRALGADLSQAELQALQQVVLLALCGEAPGMEPLPASAV